MPSSSPRTFRVLDTTAAFDEAKDAWKRLEQATAHSNVSASYDWLRTWWEVFEKREDNQFGYDKKLRILTAWRGDALEAVVPLVRLVRKKWLLKVSYVEFLGQQWGATWLDLIAKDRPREVVEAAFEWLRTHERFDVVRLAYLTDRTQTFDLRDPHVSLLSACPMVEAAKYGDYAAFEKTAYSAKLRYNIRRWRKKVAEQGLACTHEVVPGPAADLDDLARLSRSKMEDDKRSLYLDADKRRFVDLVRQRVPCDVELVKLDGRSAAYRVLFRFGAGVFSFDTSYDRKYRDLSLGHLLYVESIRRFFEQRLGAFQCCGTGVNPNKLDHYKEMVRLYSFTRPGNTILGYAATTWELSRQKRIEQAVRASLAAAGAGGSP